MSIAPFGRRGLLLFSGLLLLVFLSFADYLRVRMTGGDDLMWRIELENNFHPSYRDASAPKSVSVVTLLGRAFTGKFLAGHFAPVSACLWTLLFGLFGSARWSIAVIVMELTFHAASAAMLVRILGRLRMPKELALTAGIVFAVHPVSDIPLANANAGMNVNGLFFTLLAVAAFLAAGDMRSSIGRIAAFGTAAFCAMNANPVFMAITPLAVGSIALFEQIVERRPRRAFFARAAGCLLVLTIALGATVILRTACYGRVGTRYEPAPAKVIDRSTLGAMCDLYVTAGPGDDLRETAARTFDVRPDAQPSGRHRAIGWLLAAAVAAAVFAAGRGDAGPREGRTAMRRTVQAFGIGVLLLLSTAGVYRFMRGTYFPHRYYHIGILGVGPLVAAVAALPIVLKPSTATRAIAAVAVGCLVLYWSGKNAESQVSLLESSRIIESFSRAAAKVVADEPDIERLYVTGAPAACPRAGHIFPFYQSLSFAVFLGRRADLREAGRPPIDDRLVLTLNEQNLLDEWNTLQTAPEWRDHSAVMRFDPLTAAVTRVSDVENPNDPDRPTLDVAGPRQRLGTAGRTFRLPWQPAVLRAIRGDIALAAALARTHPGLATEALDRFESAPKVLESPQFWELLDSPVDAVRRAAAAALARNLREKTKPMIEKVIDLAPLPDARRALRALLLLDDVGTTARLRFKENFARVRDEADRLLFEARVERIPAANLGMIWKANAAPPGAAELVIDPAASDLDRRRALRAMLAAGAEMRVLDALWETALHAPFSEALWWSLPEFIDGRSPNASVRLILSAAARRPLVLDAEQSLRSAWPMGAPAFEEMVEAALNFRDMATAVHLGRMDHGSGYSAWKAAHGARAAYFPEFASSIAARKLTAADLDRLSGKILVRCDGGDEKRIPRSAFTPVSFEIGNAADSALPGGIASDDARITFTFRRDDAVVAPHAPAGHHFLPWTGIPARGSAKAAWAIAAPAEPGRYVIVAGIVVQRDGRRVELSDGRPCGTIIVE